MATYSTIRVETTRPAAASGSDGRVTTITLDRPQRRNALTAAMIGELTAALNDAESSGADLLVLRGAGEHFCSGLDLSELQAMRGRSNDEHWQDSMQIAEMFRALWSLSVTTIAVVRGAAMAGGMGLATLCDFTLCSAEARFGYTEVKIGFIPAIVSVYLRRQVHEKVARELLLSGRIVEAAEALAMGLVTRQVPAEQLEGAVEALVASLLRNSPASMRATKRLLHAQDAEAVNQQVRAAVHANAELRRTEDFREGVASFLEKRAPVWPSRA